MDRVIESLQPRGALAIVDDAAAMLRRRTSELILLSAIAVLPSVVIGLWVGLERTVEQRGTLDPRVLLFTNDGLVSNEVIITQLVFSSIGLSVMAFALTRLTVAELLGRDMSAGAAIRETVPAIPGLVLLWVIVHVIEGLGLIAFGVGAVVAMVVLLVAVPVYAAEPIRVVGVAKRCLDLSRGARGRLFTVVLVTAILNLMLGFALATTPTALLGLMLDGRPLALGGVVFQTLAAMAIASITAGAAVQSYIDLRVRLEGLDLDIRLRALS